ncbi:MAG: TolC family protein [Steroidobacteraceae bacterium]
MKSWIPVTGLLAMGLLLVGCTTIPADRGASVTNDLLKSRSTVAVGMPVSSNAHDQNAEVVNILAEPINADQAVRLALLQNPHMRALYTELGLAQADVYDAGRLSNPSLGYLRLSGDGDTRKTTWSISQSFTELLFLGYRKRVSLSQMLQTQQRVASEVLALEADVRSAYYNYVGATLIATMREHSLVLARASSQYAQELFDAGNINSLQRSREQAQASEAAIQQQHASIEQKATLGRLMNLLGLSISSPAQWLLSLPLPIELHTESPALQAWAREQRLDLAALHEQVSMNSTNLTHVRRWRWVGGVQVNAEREQDSGSEPLSGLGAELELPLFNQGGGNLLRAQAALEATQAGVAGLELSISNDIAVQYAALQAAQAIVAEYREKLTPLRQQIVTLNQQQQNFMLIGTFELLLARQQQMDTYQGYLQAVSDYWVTHSELLRIAGGKLPPTMQNNDTGISIGVDALVTDVASSNNDDHSMHDMDHSGHDMPTHDMSTMQPASGETP